MRGRRRVRNTSAGVICAIVFGLCGLPAIAAVALARASGISYVSKELGRSEGLGPDRAEYAGAQANRASTSIEIPGVRLFVAQHTLTVLRSSPNYPVSLDFGIWVASVDGTLMFRVSRAGYAKPIEASQVDSMTGSVIRAVPSGLVDGWFGLKDFIHLSVRSAAGNVVFRSPFTFCPNGFDRARTSDLGPEVSAFPPFCGLNPFTRGMFWGIDDDWAVDPFGSEAVPRTIRLTDGQYFVHAWIDDRFSQLLNVPEADADITMSLIIETQSNRASPKAESLTTLEQGNVRRSPTLVPTTQDPDPSMMPDLVSLPSWRIGIVRRRNHEYLRFGATLWNAGPGPLVVEGFRPADSATMTAYQYFYANGSAITRAPVGELAFDAKRGHEHWHFQQFASYSLTDASRTDLVKSKKTSFCIEPSDPIDLTVPNADWSPYQLGVSSVCGTESAIWVREALEVGWGDTYVQCVAGQSFDITNLPNGRYYVRIEANPFGLLYESNTSNDISYRRIRLRGRPGERRVVVPPYHSIDTETSGPRC
jgi:hypothetical protein